MDNTDVKYTYSLGDKFAEEDINERKLYLNYEIDNSVIEDLVYYILRYNKEDKGIPSEKRIPIKLYINSPGGTVIDGYGLIDAILTSNTPVHTINVGQCSSMGLLIFIAGDKRYTFPHSEFLMHDGVAGVFDSTSKVIDRLFDIAQTENMIRDYVISRTKIDEKMYEEKRRVEYYFFPEEGKEIGVVDFIIGKDCSIDDII